MPILFCDLYFLMCESSCWVPILGSVIFILLFLLIYFKKLVYNYL